MIYLLLFWEFFKTGLFSVGGGMATIPFLYEMGERTQWFSSSFLTDMVAISESTPGPIGINMATYIGFSTAGILGAVFSCLGLIMPSLVIILVIAKALSSYSEKTLVKTTFFYLRACTVGLLLYALYKICLSSFISYSISNNNYISILIYVILCVLIFCFKKIHPIIWIILGAVLGIII